MRIFSSAELGLTALAANVLDQLVSCVLRCFRLLSHLDLPIGKMNQKSSVVQILKSVPRALTSDRCALEEQKARKWWIPLVTAALAFVGGLLVPWLGKLIG